MIKRDEFMADELTRFEINIRLFPNSDLTRDVKDPSHKIHSHKKISKTRIF